MVLVRDHVASSLALKQEILNSPSLLSSIEEIGTCAREALRVGGRVLLAGNGGSFADAQHIAAEFISKLMSDRIPLPAIALGTNSSSTSAIGNDYGYEFIFTREIQAIARTSDLFIPISTSGNSANIIRAIEAASLQGVSVFGLTGTTGGKMSELCRCVKVPSANTALVQECHIMIGHIICAIAEQDFLNCA
jgi:D-sedoheptulose 7-phosphate isomerase